VSTSSDAIKKNEEGKGIGAFLRDTRSEWDKTSFPSSEDVRNTTVIVIVSVIFIAIYLWLVDLGWVFLLNQLTNLVNYLAGGL
jgi:preprotein translocase subunit SecE